MASITIRKNERKESGRIIVIKEAHGELPEVTGGGRTGKVNALGVDEGGLASLRTDLARFWADTHYTEHEIH